MASRATLRVLCFGDSLTAGYVGAGQFVPYKTAAMSRVLNSEAATVDVDVDAIGHSGWDTGQLLRRKDDDSCSDVFLSVAPGLSAALGGRGRLVDYATGRFLPVRAPYDVVIILAGANDLADRTVTADRICANLQRLHRVCLDAGVKRTVAVGIPESVYTSQNRFAEAVRAETNALLAAWAESDAAAAGRCKYTPCPTGLRDLCADGLHFSAAGYDVLGAGLGAGELGHFIVHGTGSSESSATAASGLAP
jgi:lysophospholipase L1-like esterase